MDIFPSPSSTDSSADLAQNYYRIPLLNQGRKAQIRRVGSPRSCEKILSRDIWDFETV
jgi:hypothetical protein